MDSLVTIGRYQWRAFWRRFRRAGNLNTGNQGILLIVTVLVLTRYLQLLRVAAVDLQHGRTRILESLLLGIFLVWMVPLVSNARPGISTDKLLHLPLTIRELFGIRLIALLTPLHSWIILGGSLAICYPIMQTQNRVAGVIAAILFILFSALTWLTVGQLLSIGSWRKFFFALLVFSCFGIFFLVQKNGWGPLVSLSSLLPTTLVARVALGTKPVVAFGELTGLTVLAFLTALWSFKKTLHGTVKRRAQKIRFLSALRISGPVGGLAAKDFRYFRRLLDPYFGVLAAAVGSLYLVTADVPSAGLFQVFLLIVFVPNSILAFNSFGLDNRAVMERIGLMPLTGKTILLSKNLAFLMIVGLQVLPLILLGAWRMGFWVGLLGIVESASLAAMYLAWGNWMSVNHPTKMRFFQFSPSDGLLVEAIAGIVFGSLPGLIAIYSLNSSNFKAAWIIAPTLVFSILLYFVSVWHVGTSFAQKRDRILSALL